MNNPKIRFVWKLLLVIGLIYLLTFPVSCKPLTENSSPGIVNRPAPDFNLKDLDGKTTRLSDLVGKTVVINFWATTCPPCVAEMPIFQELYDEWSGRGDVAFISINLAEDAAKVRLFMDRRSYTFPVLLDSSWDAGSIYQIRYVPTTCIVDSKGYLRFMASGAFPDRAALDKLLSEFIPPQP